MSPKFTTVGWREWAALPELGVPAVKVKIDTGARTSALHALDIERFRDNGRDMVKFIVHPVPVSDSGGHSENRYVISSRITLGSTEKDSMDQAIDITLTQRSSMLFRMLVGRTALAGNVVVDPAASYLCGRLSTRLLYSSHIEAQS